VIGFSVVVGFVTGFLLPSLTRLGLALAGAALGFFLGVILYGVVLFKVNSEPGQLWFKNLIIQAMLVGAIFGYEYHQ
jgi:hypothetical protein